MWKQISIGIALVLAGWGSAQAQLLWKISGKDLTASSYIFGSNHLAPLSVKDSVAGLSDAFAAVQQVCGEIRMDEMTDSVGLQRIRQVTVLPAGQTLKDVLTPAQYVRADSVVRLLMGVGLDVPQLATMTPAALNTSLATVLYLRSHPGFNPAEQLDTYFQSAAQAVGKKVLGLETLDFQMKVLFGSKSLARQVEELMCLVDHLDRTADQANRLAALFARQDLDGMLALTEEERGTACGALPEELDALLYDRNADWAGRMPALMADGATLFVVGALHLAGERGVPALLRARGYDVEPVGAVR